MENAIKIACLSAVITGCATVSSNIQSGNYTYLTEDVTVHSFGSNYIIKTMMQVGDTRVIVSTYATECENGYGLLKVEGTRAQDDVTYQVAKSGNKKQDEIFNQICAKGMKVAYAMENKLSDADRQNRDQAAQQILADHYLSPKKKSRRINIDTSSPPPKQQGVSCSTTVFEGAAYTNCK